ncbi:neurobeachin-like protein 2 isoform X6 [Monodelphis domestica]|uniref:neurobeachin-like protein 2 isoform X6 n=1 Tax=Monodelphis domestica TaxID=13616 RepID=UPI0024E22B18|nr:neurobeachin-like protein 2 isoform X6 [Monodelphis domestica]
MLTTSCLTPFPCPDDGRSPQAMDGKPLLGLNWKDRPSGQGRSGTVDTQPVEKDLSYLHQWLEAFVTSFEKVIAVHSLEPRRPEEATSEIPLLPQNVLQVLGQQLGLCAECLGEANLTQALLLLKFFIIICRNLENVQADTTPIFIPPVITMLGACNTELKKGAQAPDRPCKSQLESVALHALHLLECLFDPYQTWRRQLSGEVVSPKEKSKYKFAPAALPKDFSTFFQESLQDADLLPPILQLRFIHLFGAIITGGKENALAAVTPSSVEGLLGVLRSWGGPSQDPQLLQLALQGLVGAVHLLHASGAPRRGPELRALLEGYFRVLNTDRPPATTQENSPTPSPTGGEEGLIMLRVSMLDAIPKMLDCADRPVLQAVFLSNNCFEHITRLIQNSKLYLRARSPVASEGGNDLTTQLLTELDIQKVLDRDTDAIAVHAVRVLTSIMSNSPSAKEVFKERIGYSHLFEVLKSQGPPTKRLLQELLNMAVEGDHNACPPPPIRNEQPLLILAQWLPVLPSSDLQVYLAERLRLLCDGGPLSQTTCVKAGLVNYLLEALGTEPALKRQAAEQLLELLQALGGVSLRPEELRCLFRLLWTESGKGAHPYTASVIRALSGMARQKGPERALRYFDLTPSMAGIMVPSIQRWPGAAFSFHAWLCLHQEPPIPSLQRGGCSIFHPAGPPQLKRKQLYSFFTPSGTGFEAFFTSAGMLVVAVCTRKEYMTVSLPEFPFNDSAWHSVAIIHVPGRRPFSQNLLYVYADGQLLKTAPLRCPSLNESFSSCCIGLAGNRTTTTTTGPPIFPGPAYPQQLPFSAHPSLSRSQSFPASMSGSSWGPSANVAGSSREGGVSTTLAGSQDTEWGSPTSLEGQLGSVVIFHEVLQPAHIRTLFTLGPNETSPFKPEGELQELSNKMLLHYTPQACKNKICLDLSPSHGLDGRLTGHKVVNWDVKDVVNCVGGMGVLLPLLEQVGSQPQEAEGQAETHDLVGPELTSSHNAQGLLIPLGKSSEGRVERNGVAAFLLMMKNFLRGHLVNQESLMQCHGPAIIGALLQKVPSHCMDMNVLMAAQMLMEQVASEGNGPLLHLLYQHLLFNFNLWSHSDFAVRLGHIQYLSSIIKEHRQKVRKKYGVQYILDSVRAHYSPQRERPLAEDDLRTVQTSLFSLVKEFLARSFSPEEMQAVLNYLAGSSDEGQICGVLDMLLNLLRSSPVQEPLCTFLLEPNNVEVLFALLVHRSFSDQLRDKVFKILNKLLKSDRVPERSKHRLKLKDCGLQGLIACLPDGPVSSHLCRGLSEQVLGTDCPNLKDLVAVVYLSHRAQLSVRLDMCRKLFHLIYGQPDMVRQLARQVGWQDILTRLYVREAPAASSPNPPEPALAELSSDVFLPLTCEASLGSSESFPETEVSPPDSVRRSSSTVAPSDPPSLEATYQPLSPFCSPFDLGPELASTGSGATVGSGENLTPVSLPGTPSPLEGGRPFPPLRGRHSSSLSNVLDETSFQEPSLGDDTSNTSNPQQAPEEELCNLLTNILFSVTWRGVEGDDEAAWRERGQVFSVLTKLGAAGELVRPPDEIKRSLLEMMLESALTDLQEALPVALPSLTQHVLKLLRLLQDFLHSEGHGNQALWSEKLFEGVSSLLDHLGVWQHLTNGAADLREMAQIGLRLVLGYMLLEDTQLHALAYVKLHGLLQTAVPPRREEACYLLAKLEAPLARALEAESERCSWLVPLVRTLLDRAYTALGLQWGLPSLPPTNGSPTFYEDFQAFCTSPEWRLFIDKQVQPAMSQFEMDTYARSHDHMSSFWNSCYDALMSSSLRRDRERTESRHLFQELVLEPVMKRGRSEGKRYSSVQKQLSSQHAIALLHWKALGRLLTAPRSAWAQRNPPPPRWKLSSAETYSRMRLKLVPNYHFDQHSEASALRDNLGATDHLIPSTEDSLPLTVAKEAKVSTLQEDQLGEEELTVLDTVMESSEPGGQQEKLVLWEDCQLITIVAVIPGRLEVTTQHLYFYDCSVEKEETEEGIGYDFRRPLSQLREVHLRRYNLRRSALELFFTDQANYFLNFPRKVRNKVYSCILGLRPPSQGYYGSHSPQEMLRASGLTQKWVHREISNFEYLMQLNTIAGRTYNDLSQYPVFPWILQDYTSETLDLNDPSVFRDLSKPIGVVNSKHAQLVREKYESFEDPTGTTDKFHYGTHYSNAAGVMHYLIRMEPFTSLHIQLQSGRFDCSDRQFHSVAAAWQARLESPADVKELIPEFFYFPDFLENQNGFDLGSLQLTNERVGDVVLPRWARSREDFIHQHRKALESEHVSAHLHEWIDLIFGCKQRGPAAVEALNVFYYCTYEGAVDLDAVADETERKALEGIISNFGQTPCQLLKEPHPPRLSAEDAARRLARLDTYSPNLFQNLDQLKAFFVEGISDGVPLVLAVVPHRQAHSFMTQGSPDLLVTVSANGLLGTHNWLPYDRNINNYFTFSKDPTVSNAKTQRLLSGPWPPGRGVSGRALAVAPDGKLLFSGGHWDGSLRVTSLPRGKLLSQLSHHIDIVTCLALDLCGLYLISGSRDTTCMVWQVLQQGGLSAGLAPKPVQVLYGHEAEVTCVAISTELDMAVSGSKDGTVIIHTIRRGQFVASLQPLGGAVPGPVAHLALGPEGQIVVQSLAQERPGAQTSYFLHLYSVNGRLLASQKLEEQSTALALTDAFVLLGTAQCNLHILHLHSLLPAVPSMSMKVPIHSVAVTKERSHILVGLEDGKLIVVGAGQPSEVRSGQFARRLWRSTRRISQVSSGETEYNPPEAK